MKFQTFLQKSRKQFLWETHNKIVFVIHDGRPPLLFFAQMMQFIRNSYSGLVEYLDLEGNERSFVISRLETVGLLGHKMYYWLGGIFQLSPKKRKDWLKYLECYQGPQALGLCLSAEDSSKLGEEWLFVDIPTAVNRLDFDLLAQLFYPQRFAACKRLGRTFSPYIKLTLDKACLLIQYGQVVGNNIKQFCDEWIPLLIESEESLFKMSEYLLSERSNDFFRLWSKIGSKYPDVFWIVFWSDTLWRAYCYIQAMRRHDLSEARWMSYKLPFAFINGGWKKIDAEKVKQAHHFVYYLDYNLKNGAGTYGLELLYAKFFLK